jgi:hypothetical protein
MFCCFLVAKGINLIFKKRQGIFSLFYEEKSWKMIIMWTILNYQIDTYSKQCYISKQYLNVTLVMDFLHDNKYENEIKSNLAFTWLMLWDMYWIWLKPNEERKVYTS